jgi:hypothetical protein
VHTLLRIRGAGLERQQASGQRSLGFANTYKPPISFALEVSGRQSLQRTKSACIVLCGAGAVNSAAHCVPGLSAFLSNQRKHYRHLESMYDAEKEVVCGGECSSQ